MGLHARNRAGSCAEASTPRGARVLAFLPPSSCADRIRETAIAATSPSGWLTLAVPTFPSRALSYAFLGAVNSAAGVPTEAELERAARLRLESHLERLDKDDRVCGVILRPPVVSALFERISAVEHDLIVFPDGWREAVFLLTLRAKTRVPLLLVGRRGNTRLIKSA